MAVYLAFLIILLIPALSGEAFAAQLCLNCHPSHHNDLATCTGCHQGDDRTARKDIAHRNLVPGNLLQYRIAGNNAVESGLQLIEKAACRRCHRVNAKGNRLSADLDRLTGRHPAALLNSILKPVTHMPDFRFDGEAAALLVNAIQASAKADKGITSKAPEKVRFNKVSVEGENVFEKHCGGCHRILTERYGGLGNGVAGPNLSGLLTPFYPPSFGKGENWTAQRLEQWLANPRQSRSLASMQPVKLQKNQFTQLLSIISIQVPSVIYR